MAASTSGVPLLRPASIPIGIAGELYSQAFYDQLARVLRQRGRLFHYTGAPNRLTSGRDVPNEVAKRLRTAGFDTELALDGVLATLRRN